MDLRATELGWLKFFGRKAKIYDIFAASPLIVWYFFSTYYQSIGLIGEFRSAQGLHDEAFAVLSLVMKTIILAFGIFLTCILFVRRTPIRKYDGFLPRIIAFLGCYAGIGAFGIPTNPPHSPLLLLSMALTAGGMCFAIYSLSWLGRSFSIMPESRKLVTGGPYSLVRHPLYLGEQTALVGVALMATSFLVPLILTLQFCCQLYRMRYEEKMLAESFPEYEQYQRETARIIPWFY